MIKLHLDFETYSSVDIKKSGNYNYINSPDFQPLLLAYAINDEPVELIDFMLGDSLPDELIELLKDPKVEKHAHNATFERLCLKKMGIDIPPSEWHCSMAKSAYCGLPLSLDEVSKALDIKNKKLSSGKDLIKYFCSPCKPTKINGGRTRNFPVHNMEKWKLFGEYCVMDVEAEREIEGILSIYEVPEFEREIYILDQEINDKGVKFDVEMATAALEIAEEYKEDVAEELRRNTGMDNPKSQTQIKKYLLGITGREIESLNKDVFNAVMDEMKDNEDAVRALEGWKVLNKTSISKYEAMLSVASPIDQRGRGLFQYYGANRTGRFAGRLVQLQNLARMIIDHIASAREAVKKRDRGYLSIMYEQDLINVLSQLLRSAIVADEGSVLMAADFSAIESRVLAYLAGEEWKLEVFRTHGKIYEATASRMFHVPIELITKDSEYRQKGKVADLSLGYQGSVNALTKMAGSLPMSDEEKAETVKLYRNANPNIVGMWKKINDTALAAVHFCQPFDSGYRGMIFDYDGTSLTVKLPSGRKLFYRKPRIKQGKYGAVLCYWGVNQDTKRWEEVDTYGGKLVENIVQAVSRDILCYTMLELKKKGFGIVLHVHDEVVAEEPLKEDVEQRFSEMLNQMKQEVPFCLGLPLKGEGFISKFYKK